MSETIQLKEPVIIDDGTSPALSSILTSLPLVLSLQLEIYSYSRLITPPKHEHVQNLICTISSILVLTLRLESALFPIDDRTYTDEAKTHSQQMKFALPLNVSYLHCFPVDRTFTDLA